MDELLELMNDDDDEDEAEELQVPKKRSATTTHSVNSNSNVNEDSRKKDKIKVNVTPSPTNKRTQPEHNGRKHPVEASVDDRLGIRMTKRLVSSNDLMELITDYLYFSPSVLSAMTLSRLNTLLQDPSPIIDYATVAGKTENLVTVGIVFSNSGTRISSKGGAFCVLTIGNLNSGPCLSIFLFGAAYGKYCCSSKPGTVIALMAPKLLPANRGDNGGGGNNNNNNNANRSVSFSVYDIGQLKLVANARDYGTCKASTSSRVKQNSGTVRQSCKHYVDKRVSREFCDFHRRVGSNGNKQPLSRFQQVKHAHRQAAPILVASRNSNNADVSRPNRFLKHTGGRNSHSAIREKVTATTGMATIRNTAYNPISLRGGNGSTVRNKNVPIHMTKQPPICRSLMERKTNIVSSSNKLSAVVEKIANRKEKRARSDNSSTDWLQEATTTVRSKGTAGRRGFALSKFTNKKFGGTTTIVTDRNTATRYTSSKKKILINNVGSDFNGSVSIPKPNKIFQQQQPNATNNHNNNNNNNTNESMGGFTTSINKCRLIDKKDELLQQQAVFSQRMKEGDTSSSSSFDKKKNNNDATLYISAKYKGLNSVKSAKNIRSSSISGDNNTFLAVMGTIDDGDKEKIRNARSQFADEVDADEYANRRRKLLELEKLEALSQGKNNKNNNSQLKQNNKRLTKSWSCQTCGQSYVYNPKRCIAQNHQLKTIFDIEKSATKHEQRIKLHGKSAEDGGLHIGSGLDWSTLSGRFN